MSGTLMRGLAVAAMLAAWPSGTVAAPVIFTGQGVVSRSFGPLPATGSATLGDPVRFSFAFDLDDATPLVSGPTFAAYTLPFTDFSAKLGDYVFTPDGGPAQLRIGRGFTFFGGSSTEPSRTFSFAFNGVPGAQAPFAGVTFEQFSVTATFRDAAGPAQPVALADVTDPASADRRTFDYFASAPGSPPTFGALSGDYQGAFTAAGGVPEPAIWTLLILGFGAVGAALRRRPIRVAFA